MARLLSDIYRADLILPIGNESLIYLLTVVWDDGVNSGTLRMALNDTDVTSNGNVFTAGAFGFELPDEDDADIPLLKLVVQDVNLEIRSEIRKLDTRYPATATLEGVLVSDNDSVEERFTGTLRAYKLNRFALEGFVELYADLSREPTTPYRMAPAFGFNAFRSV